MQSTDLFQMYGAEFSNCGKYRYTLWRIWNDRKPLIMFIGLNPSKANALYDDQTIRRCKRFAYTFGYGGMYMMNLFAYISTDPSKLLASEDPKGFLNDTWFEVIREKCKKVVFCWGALIGDHPEIDKMILQFPNAYCFGKTKHGYPKHPVRLNKLTKLRKFKKNRSRLGLETGSPLRTQTLITK